MNNRVDKFVNDIKKQMNMLCNATVLNPFFLTALGLEHHYNYFGIAERFAHYIPIPSAAYSGATVLGTYLPTNILSCAALSVVACTVVKTVTVSAWQQGYKYYSKKPTTTEGEESDQENGITTFRKCCTTALVGASMGYFAWLGISYALPSAAAISIGVATGIAAMHYLSNCKTGKWGKVFGNKYLTLFCLGSGFYNATATILSNLKAEFLYFIKYTFSTPLYLLSFGTVNGYTKEEISTKKQRASVNNTETTDWFSGAPTIPASTMLNSTTMPGAMGGGAFSPLPSGMAGMGNEANMLGMLGNTLAGPMLDAIKPMLDQLKSDITQQINSASIHDMCHMNKMLKEHAINLHVSCLNVVMNASEKGVDAIITIHKKALQEIANTSTNFAQCINTKLKEYEIETFKVKVPEPSQPFNNYMQGGSNAVLNCLGLN